MTDTILVLGATGTTGRRVANGLRALPDITVREASRHGDPAFDWTQPATWDAAVTGARAMYLMAPHGMPIDPRFVRRAVELGVRRVVLLSSRGIEEMGDRVLLAAEALVRESAPEWTILRCDWFNQNFDEGVFLDSVLRRRLVLPLGELKQGFVDAEDIAAVAVQALTADGHRNHIYELTGPEALSFPDALEIISDVTRRPMSYLGTPEDYRVANPSRDVEEEIRAWAAWGESRLTDAVRKVTGRAPKSFRAYAEDAHARGAWEGSVPQAD